MSNPALLKLLRGGLSDFRVDGGSAPRRNGPMMFTGERVHQTFSAAKTDDKKDYSKKENREDVGAEKKKKRKSDEDSGGEDSGDDDGPHFKSGGGDTSGKNGFPGKGSDGDGDGKTGEGKGKKKNFKKDDNSNGKPDFMEKKKSKD